jgi:hypothetical protein
MKIKDVDRTVEVAKIYSGNERGYAIGLSYLYYAIGFVE